MKYIVLLFTAFLLSCNTNSTENDTAKNEAQNPIENQIPAVNSIVQEHGALHIEGTKILDKNNEVVQLRGMSLFWSQWIGKYYNASAIKWLKEDWQCTVVRAAMAVDFDGYLTNPEAEKAKVMAVVDAAIEQGIYVIIDWHDHEAQNHVEEAKKFFGEMAQKYGDYPNVIYETFNEPLDISWTEVLKPYHETVIAEIRKYDPDNIIVCGTRNWSQNVDEVIDNKINDPNVAYTLHYYAATHKQWLRDIASKALENEVPLFVTEFGTTQASGDEEIDEAESKIWWQYLDDHKISWCNWSIADKEELAAALKPGAAAEGGWPDSEITTSGKLVREELKLKNKKY